MGVQTCSDLRYKLKAGCQRVPRLTKPRAEEGDEPGEEAQNSRPQLLEWPRRCLTSHSCTHLTSRDKCLLQISRKSQQLRTKIQVSLSALSAPGSEKSQPGLGLERGQGWCSALSQLTSCSQLTRGHGAVQGSPTCTG